MSAAASAQPSSLDSLRLVDLVMPNEREAAATRFMLEGAPFPVSAAAIRCATNSARTRSREVFARLYQAKLPEGVAAQAIAFFSSDKGKTAVALRQAHELQIYRYAATAFQRREPQQSDPTAANLARPTEEVTYPAEIRRAVDAFAATAAGSYFYGDGDLEASPQARKAMTDLRNQIVGDCLAGPD